MDKFSTEKYIGIPYQEKGRTFSGVDCWGLACLVYKTEFNIDLPSYAEHYDLDSEEGIAELIAREKEGWQPVETPEVGDLALFKIFGHAAHVGVVVDSRTYLEVRENRDTVLERFDSPTSKKRLVGYFRYKENCSTISVVGAPHPLKTRVVKLAVPVGLTIESVVQDIEKYAQTPQEYEAKIKVFLNGVPVREESWSTTFVQDGDQVEYRILPGKKYLAPILLIAAIIVAPQLAAAAEFAYMGTAAASIAGATAVYYGTYAATLLVASALASRISPIRPPSDPKDPGTPERQLMFTGASNSVNQYGTIPIVLGKIRTTPLLGAIPRVYSGTETQSNISLLAIWGYGPLYIDQSSYKLGEIPISNYIVNSIATVGYTGSASESTDAAADVIYGKDYDIYNSGIDLICEGDPINFSTDPPSAATVPPGPWTESSTQSTGNHTAIVEIHFPQGLRGMHNTGSNAGDTFSWAAGFNVETSVNGITWSIRANMYTLKNSKDAFTLSKSISLYPSERYVRVRRYSSSEDEAYRDGKLIYRLFSQSVLLRVSFVSNRKPVIPPKNCLLAKTAIDLTATDQLNGNMQGFNAVVQTWGKKWTGSTWINGPINNPGELFRHVLEHPANPRMVTSLNQLDMPQIEYFCNYCAQKGFTFNAIMGTQKSVLDTLRDICAAGRASPALRDGKWTVVIDEQKSVVQHFTPHNSWGFEGSKALPRYPHAIRVTFYDEDQGYQEVETIVYDTGYSQQNASLFESISLPGITKKSLVVDHIRWHFAQIKLRPEIYTLNTDIEYLVCSRGDRVKITHDVPLWGIGSGRIKSKISNTSYSLDEPVFISANTQYTIRVRASNGISYTSNIVAKSVSDYYTDIDLQTPISVAVGDLFMFGELNKESQDLIVLSIEPSTNKSARLTLIDYGVTDTYNIFTGYSSLTNNTIFETQISLPPAQIQNYFNGETPTPTKAISDDSVMTDINTLVITVGFTNPYSLPVLTKLVEAEYIAQDGSGTPKYATTEYTSGNIRLYGVEKDKTYNIRLRYITSSGVLSSWSNYISHTVVGNVLPPNDVENFTISGVEGTVIRLSWKDNTDFDLAEYEVREQNTGWGDSLRLYRGRSSTCLVDPPAFNTQKTYYIKAIDVAGNYSVNSSQVSFAYGTQDVPAVTAVSHSFISDSLASATVTIYWNTVNSTFGTKDYEITYDSITLLSDSSSITLPASWLGSKTFTIRTRDALGSLSSVVEYTIPKVVPQAPTVVNASQGVGSLTLDWDGPAVTSLPIWGYEVRLSNTGWGTPGYVFRGASSSVTIPTVNLNPRTTYYIKSIDTDNRYSNNALSYYFDPVSPPDTSQISHTFNDTSLTSATITLAWQDVSTGFGVRDYSISYNGTQVWSASTSITLPADWTGNRTFTIKTRDQLGKLSAGTTYTVTKSVPNPPPFVKGVPSNGSLLLDWSDPVTTSLPIWGYEVRLADTGWGSSGWKFRGAGSSYTIPTSDLLPQTYYYIKTIDTDGQYSSTALSYYFNPAKPSNVTNLQHTFQDDSLTSASITISWDDVAPEFGLSGYIVEYAGKNIFVKANSIILPADWLGNRTFTIKTVDNIGQQSSGTSIGVSKLAPNPPTDYRSQVIDNTVMLYWKLPAKTTLPIDHVLVKKGDSWLDAQEIGQKKGEFTTVLELRSGYFQYWIAAVDTDGNESEPISLYAQVSEPPDFEFFGELSIDFASSTLVNAELEGNSVVIPLKTSETWQQHFTSNSWTSPQNQINSGYPIYAQPANTATGFVEYTFDYGTLLASSKVSLDYGGTRYGDVQVVPTISISPDNSNWLEYPSATSVFGTNFRYVKVRVSVTSSPSSELYRLEYLKVVLDAKKKTDSLTISALSTDLLGTKANFNKEFIDIQSITATARGTESLVAVVDVQDSVLPSTYSVLSSVCTVTYTAHGFITGQNVRIYFSTGSGINGVYTIASHQENSFTVNMATANTSGNCLVYPESCRVYLFDNNGTRQSGQVSIAITGY